MLPYDSSFKILSHVFISANQETIVELMSFFKQVLPTDLNKSRESTLVDSSTMNISTVSWIDSSNLSVVFHHIFIQVVNAMMVYGTKMKYFFLASQERCI